MVHFLGQRFFLFGLGPRCSVFQPMVEIQDRNTLQRINKECSSVFQAIGFSASISWTIDTHLGLGQILSLFIDIHLSFLFYDTAETWDIKLDRRKSLNTCSTRVDCCFGPHWDIVNSDDLALDRWQISRLM